MLMEEVHTKPDLRVIVAYPHAWDQDLVEQFRGGMTSLLTEAETNLNTEHPSLRISPLFTTGWPQSSQRGPLDQCAVALLDVSEFDEEQALLIGYMRGANVPVILISKAGRNHQIPGFPECDITLYRTLTQLFSNNNLLRCQIVQAISQERILQ